MAHLLKKKKNSIARFKCQMGKLCKQIRNAGSYVGGRLIGQLRQWSLCLVTILYELYKSSIFIHLSPLASIFPLCLFSFLPLSIYAKFILVYNILPLQKRGIFCFKIPATPASHLLSGEKTQHPRGEFLAADSHRSSNDVIIVLDTWRCKTFFCFFFICYNRVCVCVCAGYLGNICTRCARSSSSGCNMYPEEIVYSRRKTVHSNISPKLLCKFASIVCLLPPVCFLIKYKLDAC